MPYVMVKKFVIPGIMQHVERAGIHSGDSISVYPARDLYLLRLKRLSDIIQEVTGKGFTRYRSYQYPVHCISG